MEKVKEGYFSDCFWYDALQRFLLFTHPLLDRDHILTALALARGKKLARNLWAEFPPLDLTVRSQPLLSVVISCYNYGGYLPETLESLKQQTFSGFEVILVDDGSDEPETLEILAQLKKDPALTYIAIPHQGPSSAKNTGIKAALGKYVCCLDADDRLEPTYLEKALKILENRSEIDLVYSWVQCFGAKTELQQKADLDLKKIVRYNQVSPGAVLRKSCWEEAGGYNLEMNRGLDDWEFWIHLSQLGKRGLCIPEPLYLHREHDKSLTALIGREEREDELKNVIKKLHPDLFNGKQKKSHKILILAPESLGDLILSLPLLNSLRANYPQSSITVVASPRSSQVLEHHPAPNRLVLYDFSWGIKKQRQVFLSLNRDTYDLLFCLPAAVKYYLLAGKIKAVRKLGYFYPVMWMGNLVSFLSLHTRVSCPDDRRKPNAKLKHEMIQYLELVKALGLRVPDPELGVPLNQDSLYWAERFLAERGLNSGQPLIGIQLDRKLFADPEECLQFYHNLSQAFPDLKPLFLAYRENEQKLASNLPDSVAQSANLDFKQWAALLKNCRVLISFDGGAVHLASALKIPVLAVFPEHDFAFNAAKWHPWGVPYRLLAKISGQSSQVFNREIIKGLGELREEKAF